MDDGARRGKGLVRDNARRVLMAAPTIRLFAAPVRKGGEAVGPGCMAGHPSRVANRSRGKPWHGSTTGLSGSGTSAPRDAGNDPVPDPFGRKASRVRPARFAGVDGIFRLTILVRYNSNTKALDMIATGLLALTIHVLATSVPGMGPIQVDLPTIPVPTGDAAMSAAFAKARAGVDDFLARLRNPPAGSSAFSVKIGLIDTQTGPGFAIVRPDQPGETKVEWFWISHLREVDGGYEGLIDNEPESIRNIHDHQIIRFVTDDIGDWMYLQNGRIVGNATLCPELVYAPESDRQMMRDRFGVVCE